MKTLRDINSFKDKKALLRVDFDVPILSGKITEVFRIQKQKATIDHLIDGGAKVAMIAHISNIDSFEPVLTQIEEILGRKIVFIQKIEELRQLENGNLYLLDNIRKWPGEEKNDLKFGEDLASGFDLFVNNAFAVSHRKHASVSAVAKFLPAYAGFVIEEEVSGLSDAVSAPKKGKVIIMGGAKASTKIPVIKNFMDKAEKILLGGVIVNDILKAGGVYINDSVVDENSAELLADIDLTDPRLVIPDDFGKLNGKILDIGPNTTEVYKDFIRRATMVIWNGPLGLFEDDRFALGTNSVAEATALLKVPTIIGGGDTVAAVNKLGLLDKFSLVSTGGGAMLEFLAGKKLPGLEALGYYS